MATATKEQATKIKLTKTNIDKLSPASEKRTIYWDSDVTGFGLRVLPSGARTFFYQGRVDGELIRVTIGKYPVMKPEAARTKAKEIQGQFAGGTDPRPDKAEAGAATFGEMMMGYVAWLEGRGSFSAHSVKLQLEKNIKTAFPRLWKKPANEITIDDCDKIVDRLESAGKPRQADKIRSYMKTAFRKAIMARGKRKFPEALKRANVQSNPVNDIEKPEGASKAKDRALSVAEFQSYWRRIKELPEPNRSVAILHVLTGGQRQVQLARVTLNDIDRDLPAMTIYDYKGRNRRHKPRLHIIPLLPGALEAIDAITGTGEFVFSCDGGLAPVGSGYLNDIVKRVRKQMEEAGELEKGHFTPGSIRATIETRLAAKPYRVGSDVLAQLLSHGMGGVQARHYQHHDFFEEKLEALQMLSRLVEGSPEPVAEVIPMRRARA